MTPQELLLDAFGRVRDGVADLVTGMTAEDLAWRPGPKANSVAWLVWHLTRIQDDHVAGVAGTDQVWTTGGWHEKLALPFDPRDTGYGHDADQVAAVRPASGRLLADYHDAVHAQTVRFLGSPEAADLDRVVDTRWDPPVTLAVRLVSVIGDDMAHLGQAQYAQGLRAAR